MARQVFIRYGPDEICLGNVETLRAGDADSRYVKSVIKDLVDEIEYSLIENYINIRLEVR